MTEPEAQQPMKLDSNVSPREVAGGLLMVGGMIMSIAVGADGTPAVVAWLAMFVGMALSVSTKSSVVRFGGAFILSLVLLIMTLAVHRCGSGGSVGSARRVAAQTATVVVPTVDDQEVVESRREIASTQRLANQLGGGPQEAERIRSIAEFYGVAPTVVADQAAKAAELCLDGDDMESRPADTMRFFAAALLFVDKATRETAREMGTKSVRELLPLVDTWVTYVSMGCPK